MKFENKKNTPTSLFRLNLPVKPSKTKLWQNTVLLLLFFNWKMMEKYWVLTWHMFLVHVLNITFTLHELIDSNQQTKQWLLSCIQAHHNQEVIFFFKIYWLATKQRDLQGHCVGVRVLFYESLRTYFWGFFFLFLYALFVSHSRGPLWATAQVVSVKAVCDPGWWQFNSTSTTSETPSTSTENCEQENTGCETKSVVNKYLLLFTLLRPFSIL